MQERYLTVNSLGDGHADQRIKLVQPQNWPLYARNLPNGASKGSGVLLVKREQQILHARNGGRIEDSLSARLMQRRKWGPTISRARDWSSRRRRGGQVGLQSSE